MINKITKIIPLNYYYQYIFSILIKIKLVNVVIFWKNKLIW